MIPLKCRAWVKEVFENGEFAYGGYMIESHQIKSIYLQKTNTLIQGTRNVEGIEYFEQGRLLPGLGHLERLRSDEIELMFAIGLKDLWEGDIISDNIGTGYIEYVPSKAAFRVNYGTGRCKWFIDYLDSELDSIEVIGTKYDAEKTEIDQIRKEEE
jgi:hypothetical protein